MPLKFNTLLREAHIRPSQVCLIRHKDQRADKGRGPYELWRDKLSAFEDYQSTQNIRKRKVFSLPYWAAFVVNMNRETLFAGLYAVSYSGLLPEDRPKPSVEGEIDQAGSCDLYQTTLDDALRDFIGKLIIDWGQSMISFAQYAKRHDKPVLELRRQFREESFPGFMNFAEPLSRLDKLPLTWVTTLSNSRGVYVLSCPFTREIYVGSATGAFGFWGRWLGYIPAGHGGNVELISRGPADYQVSVLEVAGTSASDQDVLAMESRWKLKLRPTLNKN